ncbi:hypothetical protein [Nonomuraea sediminis]|uniref:hypothetical protein n=1 Tax=Nonomuraea sediminis TaxID=2835864 RepID=UPI001BDCB725|nr:hypothetical protein [Nonomuraea sediminis]
MPTTAPSCPSPARNTCRQRPADYLTHADLRGPHDRQGRRRDIEQAITAAIANTVSL